MITSWTSPGSTLARSSEALMATLPSSDAGSALSAPLKAPTGVRAAEAITIVWSESAISKFSLQAPHMPRITVNGRFYPVSLHHIAFSRVCCNAQ